MKIIMRNALISILLATVGLLTPSLMEAQLNLKIGYNLNYSPFSAHNSIFENYNSARPWLSETLTDIHFSNGLQLGLRYRNEVVGADLTWERSSNSKNAKGLNPNGENILQELEYATNRVGLGLETYQNFVGLGANVYFERMNISSPLQTIDSDQTIFKDDRFGSKIYLIFNTKGSNFLSISLQPYVAFPFSSIDLNPLANHLLVRSERNYFEESMHFGLSLVFYNGAQN